MQVNEYFDDPANGVWNLYVCLTTANFPDVMMPNYDQSPASCLPFISFMICNFYFFMKVVLAVIQDGYSARMKESYAHVDDAAKIILEESFAWLHKAELADSSKESRDDDLHEECRCSATMFLAMCSQLRAQPFWKSCVHHRNLGFMKRLECMRHSGAGKYDVEKAKLWFSILDVSSDGNIELCEFLRFVDVASCPFSRNKPPKPRPLSVFKRMNIFAFRGVFLRMCPQEKGRLWVLQQSDLTQDSAPWLMWSNPFKEQRELKKAYHVNVRFASFMDLVLITQLVNTVMSSGNEKPSHASIGLDFYTGIFFAIEAAIIFVAEMTHEQKVWYLSAGWQAKMRGHLNYFFSASNLVDLAAVALTWVDVLITCGTIRVWDCNDEDAGAYGSAVGLARIIRILRFINRYESFSVILRATVRMAKNLIPWLFNLFALFFLFAIVGIKLLSNTVTEIDWTVLPYSQTAFGEAAYYRDNNFNNFGRAFITLFELMVVNNWHVIVEGHVVAVGTRSLRLFFFVFNVISSIVVVNILVSIMIGMYGLVLDSTKQEFDRIKHEKDLAHSAAEVSTPRGRHSLVIPHENAKDDFPGPEENNVEHATFKAIQARLDTLTDIALTDRQQFGSFLATAESQHSHDLRTSQYNAIAQVEVPQLVLRGRAGVPDRPLWYIQHKVDRQTIFKEDAGFNEDKVLAHLESVQRMFEDTMNLMPVAVALRHENGMYLHCNAAWAEQFQMTPLDLIGKFDSMKVNHEWRMHRLGALSQREGLYKHTEIWELQGRKYEYEVTEVRVTNTHEGWRVLMSIGTEIRPYGEHGELPMNLGRKPGNLTDEETEIKRPETLQEENSRLRAEIYRLKGAGARELDSLKNEDEVDETKS
eukprot:TRINITY_DN15427_c0_g1_i2.p1 TRINITY_DN15427_c0_g1~~TRINITY_DN15427_c0_g1_i2.p1  ORF type:complete len:870 (-),score=172.04 TRINITY_DN15427_c0_g1_i2:50-2659(-)